MMKNKILFSVRLVVLSAIVISNASCTAQVAAQLGEALVKDLVALPGKLRERKASEEARKAAEANSVSDADAAGGASAQNLSGWKAPSEPEPAPSAPVEAEEAGADTAFGGGPPPAWSAVEEAVAQAGPDSAVVRVASAPSAREPELPAQVSDAGARNTPVKPDGGGAGAAAPGKDTLGAFLADRDDFTAKPQKAQDTSYAPPAADTGGAQASEAEPDRPEAGAPGDFTDNSIDAEMIFVEGGTFTMGCAADDADCYSNEKPARKVTLSDFYIGKYEITQKQWKAVMGENPSLRQGDSLPVENVSGYDVKLFIDKLNGMTKTGKTYRLPTEAEWEYAARGGAGSKNHAYSGGALNDVAWHVDNGDTGSSRVGSKAPNELGIHDMSGNVWELVGDWYGSYGAAPLTDPAGPLWGSFRTMRGGAWSSNARACRISSRMSLAHDFKSGDMGFRLAVGTQETKPATLAQTMLALQPPRSGSGATPASSVSAGAAESPPSPSEESYGYGESRRGRGAYKPLKGTSIGIGGFYGGDYGGGMAWADGEELAMPYGGAGTYLFFDAVYAEVFAGYSAGGGKWESASAKNVNDLPEMSRTYLNVGVLMKYPLAGGAFFPLIGVDYEASVSGKLEYASGNNNMYRFDIKNWRHDADALSALWLKFGCGFDINIARSAYLRIETMYGFRTANTFEKYDAKLSNNAETRPGHGLTLRVGAAFRFAE